MRLLKVDTLYPAEFLQEKKRQYADEIVRMSFPDYHNWLIKLRMNYSDFYTFNLSLYGWTAEEFFLNDDIYLLKCGKLHYGIFYKLVRLFHRFHNFFSHTSVPFSERILKKHIEKINPDVLLIREEVNIRSSFWEQFRKKMLVVSRMDCGLPKNWSPFSFDVVYSNIPAFRDFFIANNVTVRHNQNGFDKRIFDEINYDEKKYDLTFVGGLGSYYGFINKSETFEKLLSLISDKVNFAWWGYKTGNFDEDYPLLAKHYKGKTGGLEMFQIYAASKMVINDYGAGVGGVAVNMRIFEVLGMGSLLITRDSKNLADWNRYLATYFDEADCAKKIMYYLTHESEAQKIAKAGQQFVFENYNYKTLMQILGAELKESYKEKFN